MRETETYVKVHDFIIDQLKLPDIPRIVFAVIFTATLSDAGKALYGCSFIAKRAHICTRMVKGSGTGCRRRSTASPFRGKASGLSNRSEFVFSVLYKRDGKSHVQDDSLRFEWLSNLIDLINRKIASGNAAH